MNTEFSPARSAAIRSGLVDTVDGAARRSLGVGAHRWMPAAALLVVGLVTGGAVSAAAVTALHERDSSADQSTALVPAPPGVSPGQPIVSMLGLATSYSIDATTTLTLPPAPAGATHVRVTVTCLTPGSTAFGFDPGGNNPSTTCSSADFAIGMPSPAWMDFPLPGERPFFITESVGATSVVAVQYVNYVQTALGVNARGETYGVAGPAGEPDLVGVVGLDAAGVAVDGYARATDLNAFGPDWPDVPSNPTEAMEWQAERDRKYPDGWDIPVFESDGETRIGTFRVGN